MVASNTQNRKSPAESHPADGLDAIPMKRMAPATVALGIGGVIVVVTLAAVFLSGSKPSKAHPEDPGKANVAHAAAKTPQQEKAEREHRALTERAIAAAEAKRGEEAAAASAAAASAEAAKAPAVGAGMAPAGAAPAPKPMNTQAASKAKDKLDSIADQALQGLQ